MLDRLTSSIDFQGQALSLRASQEMRDDALHGLGLRWRGQPLFYTENNRMLFGDAKKMLYEVLGDARRMISQSLSC